MLIGMDNQGWMPVHVESSRLESDNLRLVQSVLSPRCILMGSIRMPEQGRGTQGSVVSTPVAIKQPGGRRSGFQPRNSMRVMMTLMMLMLAGLPECVAFRPSTATVRAPRSSSIHCSTQSPAAIWRRCTPSSVSFTERSCRSRRSGWCRSPGARGRRRSNRCTVVGRASRAPSGTRSSTTRSPSSRRTAGERQRQGLQAQWEGAPV